MKKYEIYLETLAPLLCSPGQEESLFDVGVHFDEFGFPYLPARTFKGLLRESMTELSEIDNVRFDAQVISDLLGKTGSEFSGRLLFSNFKVINYQQKLMDLKEFEVPAESIRNYYTGYISQTALEQGGIAKEKSLRTYQLVKAGVVFESNILINEDLNESEKDYLKYAIYNIRYLGVRRNRGFGKVKWLNQDFNGLVMGEDSSPSLNTQATSEKDNKLIIHFVTTQPIITAVEIGEQNTVNTELFFSAQTMRGLIAKNLINHLKIDRKVAHNDDLFNDVILSDKVKYNPAFINNSLPLPNVFGEEKNSSTKYLYNQREQNRQLKWKGGFGHLENDVWHFENIKTSYNFHNRRLDDRVAGRSTQEDGDIFYYESIDAGQEFVANIQGPKDLLEKIAKALNYNRHQLKIGKSRSAQYGSIQLKKLEFKCAETSTSGKYIVALSPVIVQNDFGMALPAVDVLNKELASHKIIAFYTNITKVESYNNKWLSKTPMEYGFGVGSTFVLDKELSPNKAEELELNGLGIRKQEGYGRVKIMQLPNQCAYKEQKANAIPPNAPISEASIIPGDVDLKTIWLQYQEENELNDFRLKGLKQAGTTHKNKKIPTSLVHRLIEELKVTSNLNDWQQFMKTIKNKKAGNNLEKVKLFDPLNDLTINGKNRKFKYQKAYWISCLTAIYLNIRKKRNYE